MSKGHDIPALLRVTWLLFSDISTRLNILSDECAHLQDTIFGFLPTTSNATLGTSAENPSTSTQAERPWVALNPRCRNYHELPNHERALINLWNSVGSLAKALDAHRLEVSESFLAAIRSILDKKAESADIYWFAAQRGHFLHNVFEFHTQQLQHAHQKLIQLLENMPGSLPNPLLLRRWHSAFYGEFLSEYSRHVNWQTQVVTWELLRGNLSEKKQFDDFGRWRNTIFLTHTWGHIPTSLARQHRIDRQGNHLSTQFGTIWSSFFYLEQPILFPLLYHECAHFRLADSLVKKTRSNEKIDGFCSSAKLGGRSFFDSRDEAAATLGSLVQLNIEDAQFWHQFTEEVWADVVSIALGGTGYFAALFLQVFGHCGGSAYSTYEACADELIDIETFGKPDRRVREMPWPIFHANDHTYFWEARLRIAIEMTRLIHGNSEWLKGIVTTIDSYLASYKVVFSSDSTSQMHETYANLRIDCNEWAAEVCLRCLKPHVDSLKSHKDVDDVYRLDTGICDLIARAVTGYQDTVLKEFPNLNLPKLSALTLPEGTRLEDLSFLTRWHLSDFVVHALAGNDNAEVRRTFVTTYANYMRNDGGTAFRLGLEWCVAKKEMYDAMADTISVNAKWSANGTHPACLVFKALKRAADQDRQIIRGGGFTEEQGAEFLRRKRHLTRENYLPRDFIMSFPFTNEAIRKQLTQALKCFGRFTVPEGHQVRVGTLYLGVLRPWEIAAENNLDKLDETNLYAKALEATRVYFAAAHEELVRRVCAAANYRHDFAPLVGEYSFLSYSLGVTPAERDIHPWNVPKHFTKPRFVIEVFRGGRAALGVSNCNTGVANQSDSQNHPLSSSKSPPYHGKVEGSERLHSKNALLAQSEKGLGRLTLFRFRYRWQWLEVFEFVKAREYRLHPILWLSSGWEDAILITWHRSENEYWRQHGELLKVLGDDVECQSNAIVPDLLKENTEVTFPKWKKDVTSNDSRETWVNSILCGERNAKIEPFCEERREQRGLNDYTIYGRNEDNDTRDQHVVERVNRRTGRYDYTIVWKRDQKRSNSGLKDFAEIMQGLPTWFWRDIGRISTSYEERVCVPVPDRLPDENTESVLVSRILMRTSSGRR